MNGLIALLGSGEYLPVMDAVDRYLLDSRQRTAHEPNVVCLPTAAGEEGDDSVNYWLDLGVAHFQRLGVPVTPARIIDRASANDPAWIPALKNADLIYFSGGKPGYLHQALYRTKAWDAAQSAWSAGAAFAGCSAGAMILAQYLPNVGSQANRPIQKAFGILPFKYILPHFDKMSARWAAFLKSARLELLPGEKIIGIDDETAFVGKRGGEWRVMGQRRVHIITREKTEEYPVGETLAFE